MSRLIAAWMVCGVAFAGKGVTMNECTKTVTPADAPSLQSIVAGLPEGAVLCFSAGVYRPVQLTLDKGVTLRGLGDVVLDGKFRASTIAVTRPVDVTLEQLTLKNGSGGGIGGGGNLFVVDARTVTLRQVVLDGGEADANGGGGLFARAGVVVLEHCTLHQNHGRRAHSILVQGPAKVTLKACDVDAVDGKAPAIAVAAHGQLTVEASHVAGELRVEGGAAVRVSGSKLQRPLPAGVTDGGGNVVE
jgi:hypothetical protein